MITFHAIYQKIFNNVSVHDLSLLMRYSSFQVSNVHMNGPCFQQFSNVIFRGGFDWQLHDSPMNSIQEYAKHYKALTLVVDQTIRGRLHKPKQINVSHTATPESIYGMVPPHGCNGGKHCLHLWRSLLPVLRHVSFRSHSDTYTGATRHP